MQERTNAQERWWKGRGGQFPVRITATRLQEHLQEHLLVTSSPSPTPHQLTPSPPSPSIPHLECCLAHSLCLSPACLQWPLGQQLGIRHQAVREVTPCVGVLLGIGVAPPLLPGLQRPLVQLTGLFEQLAGVEGSLGVLGGGGGGGRGADPASLWALGGGVQLS